MAGRKRLGLSLAINDYDHVRDLVNGEVAVEGVELTCLSLGVEEIFFRFSRHREWDVSELSLAKFTSLRSRGDGVVGIPVFPSRAFRHSALFVRDDGPVGDPAALAGARIGIPEWTQTATVYVRGLLAGTYGVAVEDVAWFQGGVNAPGRVEGISIDLPAGISCTPVRDRTLEEMLVAGEIDAVISAHPPDGFLQRSGRVVRLFDDYRAVEEAAYRDTGVFPIMHVIAIREAVHERHPWVAMNLLTAFEEAKRRSLERMGDANAPRVPVPWVVAHAQALEALLGRDPWPYGIEPNRVTLEAFLGFAHAQGLTDGLLRPEDLFVDEVREAFVI